MSEANKIPLIAHRKLSILRVLSAYVPFWYDLSLLCVTAGVIIWPKSYFLLWICYGYSIMPIIWKWKLLYDYFYYRRVVYPKKQTPEE